MIRRNIKRKKLDNDKTCHVLANIIYKLSPSGTSLIRSILLTYDITYPTRPWDSLTDGTMSRFFKKNSDKFEWIRGKPGHHKVSVKKSFEYKKLKRFHKKKKRKAKALRVGFVNANDDSSDVNSMSTQSLRGMSPQSSTSMSSQSMRPNLMNKKSFSDRKARIRSKRKARHKKSRSIDFSSATRFFQDTSTQILDEENEKLKNKKKFFKNKLSEVDTRLETSKADEKILRAEKEIAEKKAEILAEKLKKLKARLKELNESKQSIKPKPQEVTNISQDDDLNDSGEVVWKEKKKKGNTGDEGSSSSSEKKTKDYLEEVNDVLTPETKDDDGAGDDDVDGVDDDVGINFTDDFKNFNCELLHPKTIDDLKKNETINFRIKCVEVFDVAVILDDENWKYLEKDEETSIFSLDIVIPEECKFCDIFVKKSVDGKFLCVTNITLPEK